MDKAVGSLVADIEGRGLADDTIIIFTSDNGGINVFDVPRVLQREHIRRGASYPVDLPL